VISPSLLMPGALFVHGWAGNQDHYRGRSRGIAALGCVCLTFDLYGHAETVAHQDSVTREDNLNDVMAAYDFLTGLPVVDKSAIAVVGSSYGGYLATILSTLRPVKWLALRAPALYKDEDWSVPKQRLNREQLREYRRSTLTPGDNRALRACAAFEGDVLLVESEYDEVVPSPVTANYRTAFANARSLTFRVLEGADHALSEPIWQQAYTSLLTHWAAEMVVKVRKAEVTAAAVP
jgi:uncharacterized protein